MGLDGELLLPSFPVNFLNRLDMEVKDERSVKGWNCGDDPLIFHTTRYDIIASTYKYRD
jgi:hypothetical protein